VTVQPLHEIKGVLTKFMRMLFPLEFRIDSLSDFAPALPFRYPLLPGEVIQLPEKIEAFESRDTAFSYYKVLTAHLAGRHEFGTFSLRLADLAGFEQRAELGVEALSSFVSSFAEPEVAGALLRLCEAVRIDAKLMRTYRGLAPEIVEINRALLARLAPKSLSSLLVRIALDPASAQSAVHAPYVHRAAEAFASLRESGAGVTSSARQTAVLYAWLEEILAAAERADESDTAADGESLDEFTRGLDNDGAGIGEDGEGDPSYSGGNEPNQRVQMRVSGKRSKGRGGQPMSPEEIQRLLDQGFEINPDEAGDGDEPGSGIYLTQLKGKQAKELAELRQQLAEAGSWAGHGRLVIGRRTGQEDSYFAYDEWDYVAADYRRSWCRLREVPLSGDEGDFYARTLVRYAELIPQVRRHFQRIRPASYRMVRGLEDGEEIDLDRTIEARVARLMGQSPDGRVYKARTKETRDVATLFLLDMSASTDEPIQREVRRHTSDADHEDWQKSWQRRVAGGERPRRIIDVNKEALVIMAQALEELGDSYAIMGFSGHGRDNVEVYVIKEFDRVLSDEVKARVGAVEPKRSTRMGTAIRHAREKFKDVSARSKHVILLSDGFPQDFDYGQDRRSNTYGIQDTMVALKELELAGIVPFCITVDRTGHDYLREMCPSSRYLVIDDIASLPRVLPKIYEQIVRW
jgi:nitric oxide reductase NorD protein